MLLKSIKRLFNSNKNILNGFKVDLNPKNRLFCSLYANQNQMNSKDLYLNPKIKKTVSMFREFDLNEKQIDSILKTIGNYIIEEKDLDHKVMKDTIECWQYYLNPPKLRANQLDKLNPEDIDFDMSVDLNYVISGIEPKLLLINANAIEFRINYIKDLPIIGGSRDLWRVFVYAPNGYYLQSWTDFLKKYHYISYRIIEWLLDKKDKNRLHPHPLIRNAKVMELPFDTIRSRYLFAKRTGLKTISNNKFTTIEDTSKIDLKTLLLAPIETYLKQIAPNCSIEEYIALENILTEMPAEEEEQIIEDMVELTASRNKNFKKGSSFRKNREEIIEKSYQIISPIER